MKTNKATTFVVMLAVGFGIGLTDARADDDSRERQAARRAQTLLRQVQEQKDALEQEKAALSEQLEKLKVENTALKAEGLKLNKSKKEGSAELNSCKEQLAKQDVELQTLRPDFARAALDLQAAQQAVMQQQEAKRQIDGELKDANNKLSVSRKDVASCTQNNIKLFHYSNELLESYRNKGIFDVLLQVEPVTQLKKVEIENVVQEYKTKIDQEKFSNAEN